MDNEIWRPIEGFEGRYEVSNFGRIKSLTRKNRKQELIMRPTLRVHGKYHKLVYRHIQLSDGHGGRIWRYVHVLVAKAFIPNPDNKPYVDHIAGTECGDSVDNLRWCTREENISFDLARKHISEGQKGERSHWYGKTGGGHSKSKPVLQYKNGVYIKKYDGIRQASRETGILESSISLNCNGKLKSAGGYVWKLLKS